MADPDPHPIPSGPFEPQVFRERSLIESILGRRRKEDAKAALETRLADQGLNNLTAQSTAAFLKEFGVSGSAARALMGDVWRHALQKFIDNDRFIDTTEMAYLSKLQMALGLTNQETDDINTAVIDPEFLRRRLSGESQLLKLMRC